MMTSEQNKPFKKGNNNNNQGNETNFVMTQVVNVSGTRFEMIDETWQKIKQNVPHEFHGQLYDSGKEVYVERHAAAFQCILYYNQGGELHLPNGLCPSTFQREIDFWGVKTTSLAKCCFAKYMSYLDDQNTLQVYINNFLP